MTIPEDVISRFWSKVKRTAPDECWIWTGRSNTKGYGELEAGRKRMKAHRISWEMKHGPIPENMFVCHRCDNPPCVNPGHLFIGTPAENARDMSLKNRGPGSKLTIPQVLEICKSTIPSKELAEKFNVAKGTIYNIRSGFARAAVTGIQRSRIRAATNNSTHPITTQKDERC